MAVFILLCKRRRARWRENTGPREGKWGHLLKSAIAKRKIPDSEKIRWIIPRTHFVLPPSGATFCLSLAPYGLSNTAVDTDLPVWSRHWQEELLPSWSRCSASQGVPAAKQGRHCGERPRGNWSKYAYDKPNHPQGVVPDANHSSSSSDSLEIQSEAWVQQSSF